MRGSSKVPSKRVSSSYWRRLATRFALAASIVFAAPSQIAANNTPSTAPAIDRVLFLPQSPTPVVKGDRLDRYASLNLNYTPKQLIEAPQARAVPKAQMMKSPYAVRSIKRNFKKVVYKHGKPRIIRVKVSVNKVQDAITRSGPVMKELEKRGITLDTPIKTNEGKYLTLRHIFEDIRVAAAPPVPQIDNWLQCITQDGFRESRLPHDFSTIEARHKLPNRLLSGLSLAESPYRCAVSHAGALGPLQVKFETGHNRISDFFDRSAAGEFAGQYMADALKRSRGNVQQASVRYNAGNGRVKKMGKFNIAKAPAESRKHAKKVEHYTRFARVFFGDAASPTQVATAKPAAAQTRVAKARPAAAKRTRYVQRHRIVRQRIAANNLRPAYLGKNYITPFRPD